MTGVAPRLRKETGVEEYGTSSDMCVPRLWGTAVLGTFPATVPSTSAIGNCA